MTELLAILQDRFCGFQSEMDSNILLRPQTPNQNTKTETPMDKQIPPDTQTSLDLKFEEEKITILKATVEEVEILNITALHIKPISTSTTSDCCISSPLAYTTGNIVITTATICILRQPRNSDKHANANHLVQLLPKAKYGYC